MSEPSAQPVQLLIALEARQYAAMLRRILEEHGKGATIRIDDNCFGEQDVPRLLEEWCTDRAIGRTSSFRLERGGNVLFGFDDYDPSEAWADISVIDFAERLRQEGIAQYRVHPVQASLLTEPVGSLLRALWNRLLRKPMSRR